MSSAAKDIVEQDVELGRLTRVGIGGVARWYAAVSDEESLLAAAAFAEREGSPLVVLGAGSNVVISDGLVDAVVVQLRGHRFSRIQRNSDSVELGAGLMMPVAGRRLAEYGYAGVEFLSVIPGMIGGGVYMNAGTTHEGEVKDFLISADIFDIPTRSVRVSTNCDLGFANRFSALQRTQSVVLAARFDFGCAQPRRAPDAIARLKALQAVRKEKQPLAERTFGSVFKRPADGEAAGWYLERVGLRGFRVGGAAYSRKHANWIVNVDCATAGDVKALLDVGIQRVWDCYGVRLEREVMFFPEDLVARRGPV